MDNVNIQTEKALGGFAAGGMNKDPVSGNEVPVGSLPHEVRDDVPAQLSEGEFVLPADVVRFIGLQKLMQLRDKAKEGLKRMNDMGQMGNSEEAKASGENPLGEFDQEEEEGDEGFDEEIDDIMMATGGSVPGKSATGQDVNNWLWNATDPNAVYRTYDPKTGSFNMDFGGGTGWNSTPKKQGDMIEPEVLKYLRSIGYTGPEQSGQDVWDAFNYRDPNQPYNEDTQNASGVTWEQANEASKSPIPELDAFLQSKGLSLQEGLQRTPGASQKTWIQRLVGPDGNPVAVDAYNDRYNAGDRFEDLVKTGIAAAGAAAAPAIVGAQAGSIGAGAASGATAGGMSTAMNGGTFQDVLKGAVKGGITGGAGAGLGQLAGKGWDAFMGSDVLPNSWMQGISNLEQGAGRLAGQVKEGLGIAGNAASSAPSIVPDASMFNPVVTTGSAAAGAGSTLGSIGSTAGAIGAAVNPGNFDKVEVIGKKQPPKDDSPIPGYGLIDPTIVERVPDKAPDAPPKEDGKFKLPKLPIKEALIGAGIGAIAGSGGSSSSGGDTTLARSNNPVVDYRPVDGQMEQLFINNRPTGRMKKKYAVGGDVNLDAYDFFAQRD